MEENAVLLRRYAEGKLPVREQEIWRYAGYKGVPGQGEDALRGLLQDVLRDLEQSFSYRVCYRRLAQLPFATESGALAKLLSGCDGVVIFAATVGLEVDRYMAKYQRTAPARALLAQALGAERIECLCDTFCDEMAHELALEGKTCTTRFSPGYGDFPLEAQRDIFALLDCGRQIGVSLTGSLLMMPTKSVTAIMGIHGREECVTDRRSNPCDACRNTNCSYRR